MPYRLRYKKDTQVSSSHSHMLVKLQLQHQMDNLIDEFSLIRCARIKTYAASIKQTVELWCQKHRVVSIQHLRWLFIKIHGDIKSIPFRKLYENLYIRDILINDILALLGYTVLRDFWKIYHINKAAIGKTVLEIYSIRFLCLKFDDHSSILRLCNTTLLPANLE